MMIAGNLMLLFRVAPRVGSLITTVAGMSMKWLRLCQRPDGTVSRDGETRCAAV